MIRRSPRRHGVSGFTLVEAIVALFLGGIVIASLAEITHQWLGGWSRGSAALQRGELLSAGLDRLTADIAAIEDLPEGGAGTAALFEGQANSMIFVRRPVDIVGGKGLEVVKLAMMGSGPDAALVRTRTMLAPGTGLGRVATKDPVLLVRWPYKVGFAYAPEDRNWRQSWGREAAPPRFIKITVTEGNAKVPLVNTIVRVHAELPAFCGGAKDLGSCGNLAAGMPPTDERQGSGKSGRSGNAPATSRSPFPTEPTQ